MACRGKAAALAEEEIVPVGHVRRASGSFRRDGTPEYTPTEHGCIPITSSDTDPSEDTDSSPSPQQRSRTRSHSPHVPPPTQYPYGHGPTLPRKPRMRVRPGTSVSFRMPPREPPRMTPVPEPWCPVQTRRNPSASSWVPPRHSVHGDPSAIRMGDPYAQSSRMASDYELLKAQMDIMRQDQVAHRRSLDEVSRTATSAFLTAHAANSGVQRINVEQKKKKGFGWPWQWNWNKKG